jgi:hypothetical protein
MKPKLIYRSAWCVLWNGLVYPFGKWDDAFGAAANPESRWVAFTGYPLDQAKHLGYL